MKLAVFVDQVFWFDGQRFSTDEAFIQFVAAFAPYVEQLVLFGRVAEGCKLEQYPLDPVKTRVCALPFYQNNYTLWKSGGSIVRESCTIFIEQLRECDLVWLCVPNPLAALFALICHYQKKPFFMLVRQNLLQMVKNQTQGAHRMIAMSITAMLEAWFQCLARQHITFTVGSEMYNRYKKTVRSPVFETACSLISHKDIAASRLLYRDKSENGQCIRLLYVGRLDQGKGLEYLFEALRLLILEYGCTVQLDVVGKGPLDGECQRQVRELQIEQWVHFHGYLVYGPGLLALYRTASIFVLPSLSEGIPQVLLEAMACGTLVVATKVGGIPDLISDGVNGVLVDPAQPQQIVQAVLKIQEDKALQQCLREKAFETVSHHTVEVERDRIITVLQQLHVWPQVANLPS